MKAIAFDLDNTLIDFMKFKEETAKAAAKAMVASGLEAPVEEVKGEIWKIYDDYGVEYLKTFSTLLWKHYKIRDPSKFEKIQQAGITAYLKKKFEVLAPYPTVMPTLRKLRKKGYLLCIVTDAPRNKAWQRIHIAGLQKMFDIVVTKDDTNRTKPSTLPFRALIKKAGIRPRDILFVGDSPGRDIKGARKAGMKTALAEYGWVFGRNSKIKPDYRLKKPSDILKVVES